MTEQKKQLTRPLELEDIIIFRSLSKNQLEELRKCLQERMYRKGEMISQEGTLCGRVLFVRSGRIKISRAASNGKEQILEVLEAGDTCACNTGEAAWACSASAGALTDCSVWILSRAHYARLVNSDSKLAIALTNLFADRLRRLSSLVQEVSLGNPKERLARFLVDMADSKESCRINGSICLDFTHEEISQRLGLVRETVTRHLQHLKRQGFLSLEIGRVVILDQAGLKRICLP